MRDDTHPPTHPHTHTHTRTSHETCHTTQEWVRDVAFCPSTPQASTTLLAACSGSKVYIWCRREAGEKSQWSLLAQLATKDTAWKLSWSEHESLLSVSCADNNAYVFKNVNVANPADWKQVCRGGPSSSPSPLPFLRPMHNTQHRCKLFPWCSSSRQ